MVAAWRDVESARCASSSAVAAAQMEEARYAAAKSSAVTGAVCFFVGSSMRSVATVTPVRLAAPNMIRNDGKKIMNIDRMNAQVSNILSRWTKEAHFLEVWTSCSAGAPVDTMPRGNDEDLVKEVVNLITSLVERNKGGGVEDIGDGANYPGIF